MSRQHWVDEFFRRRMERRNFPVGKGEFEELRALIDKRNGTEATVRGGGFSKWWLSALIPMAGLLWWAWSGEPGENRTYGPQVTEHPPETGHKSTDQQANWGDGSSSQGIIDPPSDAVATNTGTGEGSVAFATEQASAVNDALAEIQAEGHGPGRRSVEAQRARARDTTDASTQSMNAQDEDRDRPARALRIGERSDPASMNAQVVGRDGSPRSLRIGLQPDQVVMHAQVEEGNATPKNLSSGVQQDKGSMNALVDDRDEVARSVRDGIHSDQGDISAQVDEQAEALRSIRNEVRPDQGSTKAQADDVADKSSEVLDVLSERSEADAVAFMVPRWSHPPPDHARQPEGRDMPVFKLLATGDLHAFGAPLSVRSRPNSNGRSGAEAGSFFGFEYRVRAKRFSWATGIHYGSYVLKADQGTTDVKLDFVEVPLLAGIELGFGRFGLMMQGGMSVDLLFNTSGRYPLEEDRTNAGFPDDAFRTANFSWLLRPQATYHFSEHLSVSAGPLWKSQLGEVAKEGPLSGARVSSSGVSIGITWRLERSTF